MVVDNVVLLWHLFAVPNNPPSDIVMGALLVSQERLPTPMWLCVFKVPLFGWF